MENVGHWRGPVIWIRENARDVTGFRSDHVNEVNSMTRTNPRTLILASAAISITCLALSIPCATVQLIFARLNPSEALINTATSCTPCLSAISSPLILGTNTGSRSRGSVSNCWTVACRSTSRQSASCGTALGDTADVSSILRNPVSSSRRIKSSFTLVGTGSVIACNPSRGPTSTMRTAGERFWIVMVRVETEMDLRRTVHPPIRSGRVFVCVLIDA